MDDLSILFGRPCRGTDGENRFELEALAAEEIGLDSFAIPLEPVVNGDAERALSRLPRPRGRRWLYRGWMLNEEEYTGLYEAMSERGEELVVDPESFVAAAYAPHYLPLLGDHTAPARWTDDEDVREAWELAQELGPPPWVVKDHMKSAKEAWLRACFVPEGADFEDFSSICERLVALRGDRFERGFVRAPPRLLGGRSHRARAVLPTADVARLADRGTTVIEINDGGSSVLPAPMEPRDVLRAIAR